MTEKYGSIFIFIFLFAFIAVIFPTFYVATMNNTLTGGEGVIIENIAIIFLAMFGLIPVFYVLFEKGKE